ncbi:MAG: pectate lyase [Pedobacter sp.]|jgi:pectate lyase|uniref:pectate lyase family protein n=1 Tax=Pedobacter sp. TaxID=1411316 RepID=UPI003393CD20
MNFKKQLTKRMAMSFLLLLVMITFSKCKKSSDFTRETVALTTPDASSVVAATGTTTIKVDLSTAKKDEGYAYKAFGIQGTGDAVGSTASILKLYENGKEIGPAHAAHATIRTTGKGAFSHWGTALYFSASDNTDPRTNGRTYTYTLGTKSDSNTSTPVALPSTDKIIGYAMQGGTTTGGAGGKTVEVNTLAGLKAAVSSNDPLIIRVSGYISGTGYMNVKSNKTILGVKGQVLEGVGLLIYGTNNVIIRNMTIKNVVTYSNIVVKEDAHHVWVDHCDLSSDRNHGWDYYDGLLDVGRRADYVTFSYNKLHDNNVAMLIGFGDDGTEDIGHLRTTIYGNYFYNVSERQPCTRFGKMHVFNNYLKNSSGYGIGITMDAVVRTDNNYFEGQHFPIYSEFNSKPGFVSGANTNIYVSSGANKVSTAASSWVPDYEYKSVLIPAADVPAMVTANAGAILNL